MSTDRSMNVAILHPSPIERMRQERRARRSGRRVGAGRAVDTPPVTAPATLDPDLQKLKRNPRFAELLQIDDPTELAAVLEDVQTLVDRCHFHHERALLRRRMRNWRAVRRGKRQSARGSGRPKGAANFAARQFGMGLAMLWWEQTGRSPSRYQRGRGDNLGSYVEFVEMIVEAAPAPARQTSSPALPETEYLVRTSIKDFRVARNAPAEYRRRGLIEENAWLDGPASV
jgi:hypothetical protein